MAFKMKYKNLHGVVDELRNAVKAHGKQADTIEKHIDEMKESPMKKNGVSKLWKKAKAKVKNYITNKKLEGFEKYRSEKSGKKYIPASKKSKSPMNKKGPCWEGYEMIGMKKKGGRKVPNCVPRKRK